MPTASPVRVQIIASEMPLAMERASAEPRAAIESNTSSMPPTVPQKAEQRTHRHPTPRNTCRLEFMAVLSREIIARRIWCAVQL